MDHCCRAHLRRLAPAIFAAFERRRRGSLATGARDYVFTDGDGHPLSQDWLHKRVWLPTLRRLGMRERGQYNVRDTMITLGLSNGADPGWVAHVCGTSEQMLFRHYRKWMPGARGRSDGVRFSELYGASASIRGPRRAPGSGAAE